MRNRHAHGSTIVIWFPSNLPTGIDEMACVLALIWKSQPNFHLHMIFRESTCHFRNAKSSCRCQKQPFDISMLASVIVLGRYNVDTMDCCFSHMCIVLCCAVGWMLLHATHSDLLCKSMECDSHSFFSIVRSRIQLFFFLLFVVL